MDQNGDGATTTAVDTAASNCPNMVEWFRAMHVAVGSKCQMMDPMYKLLAATTANDGSGGVVQQVGEACFDHVMFACRGHFGAQQPHFEGAESGFGAKKENVAAAAAASDDGRHLEGADGRFKAVYVTYR